MASARLPAKVRDDLLSHPDFRIPWAQVHLTDPSVEYVTETPESWGPELVNNILFNQTLAHDTALKARIFFSRPCDESDAVSAKELCFIASIGDGLDGATGRAHGGVSSLLLDHLLGTKAHFDSGSANPPATATLTVDYKAPVPTPSVLLARAWVIEVSGRKIWAKGLIGDGRGKVYATGKGLFILPRAGAGSSL